MIIRNGLIFSAEDTYKADIVINNGKIQSIGKDLIVDDHDEINAEGMYVLPGLIDAHTHFDLQAGKYRAADNFNTGSIAAAYGGTTTIIDHIGFGPKDCNLIDQIDKYHNLAKGNSVIDYSFHGVIQHVNDKILSELEVLVKDGISSFKTYLTYDFKLADSDLFRILEKMKMIGGITAVHAENDDLINYFKDEFIKDNKREPIYHAKSRPDYCESEAISRVLKLAALAGDAPIYIVHLSTKKGLIEVINARNSGQKNIFVETCPQYLLLTDEEYLKEDSEGLKYIMSPPLRKQEDCDFLWDGISSNKIQIIATDHCPFNFEKEKKVGKDNFALCPNGGPGVEERGLLIFSEGVMKNRISLNKYVQVMSTNPAKIYGLYPQKGVLLPGSDADIVILNPNEKRTISSKNLHSAVDYTSYEGIEVNGSIEMVILRGDIIVKHDCFVGRKPEGKFLKRKPYLG